VEQGVGPVWQEMGVSAKRFIRLGHHPVMDHESLSHAGRGHPALGASEWVSRRHGEESRRIWAPLWPDRDVARVPIGHVTNGVHVATWMANRVLTLFDSHFAGLAARGGRPQVLGQGARPGPRRLVGGAQPLKSQLMRSIREQARRRWADQWKEALHLVGAGILLDPEAFTIGFGAGSPPTAGRPDVPRPERLQRCW